MHTSLTYPQKLEALSFKYYLGGQPWEPKTGDYYTTSRADLELYQIVEVNDEYVLTRYCNPESSSAISEWPKDRFLQDFGINRVWVPNWIFDIK